MVFFAWDVAILLAVIVGETSRQSLIADKYRSRAAATERFVTWGLDPLGALRGGLVASSFIGLTGAISLAAIGMVLPLMLVAFNRTVWRYKKVQLDEL